jgi:hypothetical protein
VSLNFTIIIILVRTNLVTRFGSEDQPVVVLIMFLILFIDCDLCANVIACTQLAHFILDLGDRVHVFCGTDVKHF